jgi:hypothetical protein
VSGALVCDSACNGARWIDTTNRHTDDVPGGVDLFKNSRELLCTVLMKNGEPPDYFSRTSTGAIAKKCS